MAKSEDLIQRHGGGWSSFKPNWLNISYVLPVHSISFLAWPIYLLVSHGNIGWQEFAVFAFMFILGAIGIDVGYHRGFSHRSFEMSRPLRWLCVFGGSSVGEGAILTWCADHRRHHRFQDTDSDPYNINRGFWWAHYGWILGSATSTDFSNCPDLEKYPVIRHQNKYYPFWLVVSGFLLPLGLGFLLGRPLQCFLLGGLFRLVFINNCTYLINSYAHFFGRRPYSTKVTARDSLICALLAQGEGWHNYHHRFPFDYRNGHRFYHYDPTKWFIYFAKMTGLARALKTTPACEIYRARIQTKMQALPVLKEEDFIHKLTESLHQALQKWDVLHLEWNQIKKDLERKRSARYLELKADLRLAREEFKACYNDWQRYVRTQLAQPTV